MYASLAATESPPQSRKPLAVSVIFAVTRIVMCGGTRTVPRVVRQPVSATWLVETSIRLPSGRSPSPPRTISSRSGSRRRSDSQCRSGTSARTRPTAWWCLRCSLTRVDPSCRMYRRRADASGGHQVEGHLAAIGVTPEVGDVVDRLLFALRLRAEEAIAGRAVGVLVVVAAFTKLPSVDGAAVRVGAAVVVVVVDAKRERVRPVVGVVKCSRRSSTSPASADR